MGKGQQKDHPQGLKSVLRHACSPVFNGLGQPLAEGSDQNRGKGDFTFNPTDGLLIWTDQQTSEPYKLVIDGMVRKPVQLSYSDLRKLPSVTQVNDFHCVEGWTMPRVEWSGFRFRELLNLVEPLGGAEYVTFHSLGETRYKPHGQAHYVESFKLSSLLDDDQELLMDSGQRRKTIVSG